MSARGSPSSLESKGAALRAHVETDPDAVGTGPARPPSPGRNTAGGPEPRLVPAPHRRAARASLARRPRGETRRPRESPTLLGGLLRCAEHGHLCYGGGSPHSRLRRRGTRIVLHTNPPRPGRRLHPRSRREPPDRPDARDLLAPRHDPSELEAQAEALRHRREEIAALIADGLLPATVARPKLEDIAHQLASIEAARSPVALPPDALIDPATAWDDWSIPQRRDVLRLLFTDITLTHSGHRQGPRADPTRIHVRWAA